MFYLKMPVIEPVVLSFLEEVGVAVIILESIVNIVRNPLPVGNRPERKMIELWLKNHLTPKTKHTLDIRLIPGAAFPGQISNIEIP